MELRQLEYFVAVAEEANFTRAAERVRISQSGVSAQIRQLERELGATLIDRSRRSVTLTVAGEAALVQARAALAATAAVAQAVGEVTGLIRGRLVVGMVVGCTVQPLFDALAGFHRRHPGIEIALLEANSGRLVDEIRSGAVDLALIGTAAPTPVGLHALTIVSEPLVALVPPGHPLASRRTVQLADISRHPIVCMPRGTGIRTVLETDCAAAGVQPVVALEASAADAVADLAARGLGVAILSASMASRYADRLGSITIRDIRTPALLALAWGEADNPALRELVRECRTAFGSHAPPAATTRKTSPAPAGNRHTRGHIANSGDAGTPRP